MWSYTLLPKILNMSLTAGIVIVLVLLARIPLKKAPKVFSYALWAVVLFRLVCPVSFSSEFSLLGIFNAPAASNGSITYIPSDIVHTEYPQVDLPVPIISKAINESLPQGEEQLVADPLEAPMALATMLWLFGIAAMLIYSASALLSLRRKLIGAVCLRDNIYLADHIPTPFVIGVFRPKIYLPSTLTEQEQSYIILHEQTHIQRLDHIVKMIAFLALTMHWFNPLVWVAFVCAVKDMEMSCDERVLKEMGDGIKGAYSTSLLSLATGRRLISGSPLAFGEGNIKGRIKNVINFKKPVAWVIAVSVVLVAALSVGFASNSVSKLELNDADYVISVELEQFNNQETMGLAIINDKTGINDLLNAISGAAKTLSKSVNDYPAADDYLVVRLNLANQRRTLCLYKDGGGNYIEEPYIGIYRAKEKFDYVYSVYNVHLRGNGTTDLTITEYDRVKITFLSENIGAKSSNSFETDDSKIVPYVDSTIRTSLPSAKEVELNKNYINQYTIKLSNAIGGYSCRLYYDTLYNKAYIVKDSDLFETGTDFARFIDSLLENTDIKVRIDNADAVALFEKYGWTLDYQIGKMKNKLNNITVLSGFNPNAYYFAYNNELSKDIGLDMSGYSNSADIDVEIYRIHESMPQEFYPIQDCRGIVVKSDGKIIGAFISAGRHNAFNACSLKGNSFEKATGQTLNEWLGDMLIADGTDERLSKLEPEELIEEYFTSLNQKDAETAVHCISKKTLLGNLTVNMPNNELFKEGHSLLLTDSDFDNLKSVKLLKVELIDAPDKNTKIFRVTMDLQYNEVISNNNGEQYWDCSMIYESPQTGWKIEWFGH